LKTLLVALACVVALGCKNEPKPSESSGSAEPAPSAAPVASVAPKKEAPWYAGSWTGSYEAAQNKLDPAPGALREWGKDDGTKGSGKGTLKLSIDEKGVLQGESEGALGSHAVTGTADAETIRITFEPKKPGDLTTFRGTAVVRRDGEAVRGPLKAGSGDGTTLRQANLELRRAP
jgi:hypothetical protein